MLSKLALTIALLISSLSAHGGQPWLDPDYLVERLGARTDRVRSQSAARLERLGVRALPALWRGLESDFLEVRVRSRDLLAALTRPPSPEPVARRSWVQDFRGPDIDLCDPIAR